MASSISTTRNGSNPLSQVHNRGAPSPQISIRTIGVETAPEGAEGDSWDEDFDDVDNNSFGPWSFRKDDDSEKEKHSDAAEGEEDAVTIYISLPAGEFVNRQDGVVESIGQEGEDGNRSGEAEEDEKQEPHGISEDQRRKIRSMSPSPQPPSNEN